jgi:hypothetical protein
MAANTLAHIIRVLAIFLPRYHLLPNILWGNPKNRMSFVHVGLCSCSDCVACWRGGSQLRVCVCMFRGQVRFASRVNLSYVDQNTGHVEPRGLPILSNWNRRYNLERLLQVLFFLSCACCACGKGAGCESWSLQIDTSRCVLARVGSTRFR